MSLPQPLPRFELGEVLGHLRTGGQVPFIDASGEEVLASLWFVVCRDRCWLLAATGDQTFAVADTEVRLDKGWTWDAVVVGRWSAPLRARTRKTAEQLLRRWKLADKGGEAFEPPPPARPDSTARVADGAVELPDWVTVDVQAPEGATWIYGFQTGREHPRVGRDGAVHRDPVWLLFTDEHQVLATERGWRRPVQEVEHVERTGRRDKVVLDGWSVPGLGRTDDGPAMAGRLASLEPDGRWAAVVEQRMHDGEVEAAGRLVGAAHAVGRHRGAWDSIGQLALAAGRSGEAVQAAREVLAAGGDPLEHAVRWARNKPSGEAALDPDVFGGLALLALPEGLPWPVKGSLEVFGTAALLDGRAEEGLALWAHRGRSARAQQARAAVETHARHPGGWLRWLETAEQWRPTETAEAREALAHAVLHAPEVNKAGLHWRLASWCHQDGVDPGAHWRLAVVEEPPDDLVQSAEAWRTAAQVAEREGAWQVAHTAWSRVWAIDVFERDAVLRCAEVAEQHLGRAQDALLAWKELERRSEEVAEPVPALWHVRSEIARLALELEDTAAALAACRSAIQGDFLVEEAWAGALDRGAGLFGEQETLWLEHVRGVLTGKAVEPGASRRASLSAEVLDGLHPGGVGWLESARQSLDTAAPPSRKDLTRGLERIQPSGWPLLAGAVEEVAGALGIDPPDVYLFRGEGAWGLSAWPTEPPLVLVGHEHLVDGHDQSMSKEALRFALAVEITHLAAGHPLLAFDNGLVGTSQSVYEAFGRYAGTAETVVDVVTLLPGVDQIAKIQTLIKLSRKVFTAKGVMDKATGMAGTSMEFLGWGGAESQTIGRTFEGAALQFRLQADRAALLLTGDLGHAVEAILASGPEAAVHRKQAVQDGLLAVVHHLPPDARLRVASLVEFATTAGLED